MGEKEKKKSKVPAVVFTQPITSSSKYRQGYCKQLTDHLKRGLSFNSFEVGVSQSTMNNWLDTYPEFAMARERGDKLRLKLLEAAGIKMVIEGNASVWKFMMQEFGMVENVNVTHTSTEELPPAPTPGQVIDVTPERAARRERIRELGKRLGI